MCKLSSLFFIYLIIFVWVLVPALAKSPNERKEWASHITHTHTYINIYILRRRCQATEVQKLTLFLTTIFLSLSYRLSLKKKKKKKSQIPTKKKNKYKKHTHGRQILMYIKSQKTHPQTQSIRHRFIFIAYLPCFSHESKRHLLLYDLSLSLLSFFRFCIFMSNVCLIIYCFKNWMIVVVGGFPFSLVRFHCS